MLINSNDLFEQIGLVAEGSPDFSAQQSHAYSVYLQIQLSEGRHELLEVKSFDDEHAVANSFCRKHKLNSLAVQIVEGKIKEAKMRESHRRNAREECSVEDKKEVDKRVAERSRQAESTSIDRSKSRRQQQQAKSPVKLSQGGQTIHDNKKANPNIGNQLYCRGMVKSKMQQTQRVKMKQRRERQQEKELTFQPKINPISAKIMQFRRQNPSNAKQNKKVVLNRKEETIDDQMKQCTFKPQINRVSNLIAHNSQSYKDEYDHFNALYRQAQTKQQKMEAQLEKQDGMFQPKINARSSGVVKETFEERLQKSLANKRKEGVGELGSQYSFKPRVGRPPRDSRQAKGQNSQLWENLYSQKLKKSCTVTSLPQENQPVLMSSTSANYYQHLVQKRLSEVFDVLDGDEDGIITSEFISVERLTKNQLIFLRPLFQELQELEVELDYPEFKRAVINLLKDSDPSVKGAFLSQKHRPQTFESYTPLINQKSRQLLKRVQTNTSIYDQLYEQGIKDIQEKEYRLELVRARQEEAKLQECSFKPHINSTSKYYIEKVLGKKINQKQDDSRLIL